FEEAARDPKRRASQMLPERVLDAHTRRMRLELAREEASVPERRSELVTESRAAMQVVERLAGAVVGGAADGGELTSEQHALLGSASNELAGLATEDDEIVTHLRESYERYRKAHEAAKGNPRPMQLLALLARVALARGLPVNETPGELAGRLAL